MAFNSGGLKSVSNGAAALVGATAQTGQCMAFVHYTSEDAHAAVAAANYFNAAAKILTRGSFIFASLDTDATLQGRIYVVTVNDGTTVTVAQLVNS